MLACLLRLRHVGLAKAVPTFGEALLPCTRAASLPQRTVGVPRHSSTASARQPINIPTSTIAEAPKPDPNAPFPLPDKRSLPARRGLLLFSLPVPPSEWPSHLDVLSPLISASTIALKKCRIGVNAIYNGTSNGCFPALWEQEDYPARLVFPDGKVFTYDSFNLQTLKTIEFKADLDYAPDMKAALAPNSVGPTTELLVCTHGSRDCRCADRGGPLAAALREEVARRGAADRIVVHEVAHVGGHKFAANALLFPTLDMLSNLTKEQAPDIVEHVLAGRPAGQLWSQWRGRIGLDEAEQDHLWFQVNPANYPLPGSASKQPKQPKKVDRGREVQLAFRTFQGDTKTVSAHIGDSLLEVGKAHDLPSLEGTCGGNIECATCHLYLRPNSGAGPAPVPEPTDDELDMLGYALGYQDGESRLGCQVEVTPALAKWAQNGGIIDLPRF